MRNPGTGNGLKIGILVTYPQIHQPLLATLLYLLSIYSYQFKRELKHNLLMLNRLLPVFLVAWFLLLYIHVFAL